MGNSAAKLQLSMQTHAESDQHTPDKVVRLMLEMTQTPTGFSMDRVVRRVATFFFCVLAFEVLLVAVAPRMHSGSVLKIAKDSVLLRFRTDSWSYLVQGDLASRQHPNSIYEATFFKNNVRFIYPPSSLLAYRTWRIASIIDIRPFWAFKITLLLAFLGTCVISGEFLFKILPPGIVTNSTVIQRWIIRLLIAALILTFLPLVNGPFLGQVQTILNFLLIMSGFLWLRSQRIAPGILLGLGCWLKPQMALFFIWGLLRRQWSFAISLAVTLALGVMLSIVFFGAHNTAEYVEVLRYLGRHGDALFTNQSLNGLLHRQMHIGSPVTWIYGYPPFNRDIYQSTLISSGILLVAAWAIPALRGWSGTTVDFLLFAMASTMASPIAWEHHYGIFFLAFLLWMPIAFQRWSMFFSLLGIYSLMTDNWAPLTQLMYTPWTFLISHVYFGGLILYVWTLLGWNEMPSSNPTVEPIV